MSSDAYLDLGDPAGTPLIVLDGPGARGLVRAAAPIAARRQLRLIAPDRPGAGSVADVTARLLGLTDELGVEPFGIVAQSGGTPYALGLAAAAAERVRGLAFLGAVAPGMALGGPMGRMAVL